TFQAMMNSILVKYIRTGKVVVYLDDILIFGNDMEEHRRLTKGVLQTLKDHDLFAKPEKCFFEQSSIEYLGMIISDGKIMMDPKKYDGVQQWPRPTKVKEVQAFLGFANFYRRFVEGFSKIAKPLTELTKKSERWHWDAPQEDAFQTLKEAFTKAPVLRIPSHDQPFRVETDTSDFATGAVLSQLDPSDKKFHPVAYYSKSLSAPERNYEIYDKEMLAVIRALEEWRHYLEGAPDKFEIWLDHLNLTYFKTAQK
ncbi:marY1-like reverse transcriptase, partial [Wolfiporia cocos MD-104 SS10]